MKEFLNIACHLSDFFYLAQKFSNFKDSAGFYANWGLYVYISPSRDTEYYECIHKKEIVLYAYWQTKRNKLT